MCKSIHEAIRENNEISDKQREFLQEIDISVSAIGELFSIYEANPEKIEARFSILKSVVIELYNISELCKGAGISNNTVTEFYPEISLKEIRNSICHINQQIGMQTQAPRGKKKALAWEKVSIADGLATSKDDGKTWISNAALTFNFKIDGNQGAKTTVGQLDHFLICQSEDGSVALDISQEIFRKLYDKIVTRINNIQ